ncbi:hypothetical protein V6N13_052379 [Hibiscus sabdariffa]
MENSIKKPFCFQNLLFLLFPCLFFIQCLAIPDTGDVQATPYIPVETISIDCGSSTYAQSADSRSWIGDTEGSLSPIEQHHDNKSSVIGTAIQLPAAYMASDVNGNDENHANDSSAVDYHVLFTSGSGSMRVGR